MAETATSSDLEFFTLKWAAAGLPKAKIQPVVQARERSAEAGRGAREAEQAAQAVARRVGELFATGRLEDFDAAMAEAVRRSSWLAPISATQGGHLGPVVHRSLQAECHRVARVYLQEHGEELAALARAKHHAAAEACVSWLQRFGFVAAPPSESATPEEAVVELPVGDRRGAVWWAG